MDDLLSFARSYADEYYQHRDTAPVRPTTDAQHLRAVLGGPLPVAGTDAMETLRLLTTHGQAGVVPSTSGRYFGYVMGGAHPVGVATDWITSVWDQGGTIHETTLIASVVDDICADWVVDLFGLPAHTSVGITSGCALSNLTALAAARHHVGGGDVLVSEGCHATVHRALRLLGLADRVRRVPVDDQGRMRHDELETLLGECDGPPIVCGQVGHVDTGASEDVERVAALTHRHQGWLHLDAAFGMWAAASPVLRSRVSGLHLADSWATDAHKWLNVPYDCGIVLTAHPAAHRAALHCRAPYLLDDELPRRDPFDYIIECSRRARSLALWATLRHLGTAGVADLVERSCRQAAHIAGALAAAPGVEVLNEVVLNQVLVRFGDSDEHTDDVISFLHESGVAFASATTWRGRRALRISVCNWQTTVADCDALVGVLLAGHSGQVRDLTG
ncbi:aspartate aminotransferase family protein [Lentzea tibetensis]|uniref:Aspartate aminotransferase family protein n=1 Tax=Lentzea tibetensis TaxID=2591470 RepID=A0A563F1F1_9PSEU|nr:aminotransferase class V-fold PLP-dependent enzyme [Lentzea tibetensis]TWP53749.1 aspartate aminotransferase family protein [Lentzea tibetensis]